MKKKWLDTYGDGGDPIKDNILNYKPNLINQAVGDNTLINTPPKQVYNTPNIPPPVNNDFLNIIYKSEGLEPNQTPFRYTNNTMKNWNNIHGFPVNKNANKGEGRNNFIYLQNNDDVLPAIKKQWLNYQTNPKQYGLSDKSTLGDALKVFDQTGSSTKFKMLKDSGIDTNTLLKDYKFKDGGDPTKKITSSDIKAPTGWLENYAINDNTQTTKPVDKLSVPLPPPTKYKLPTGEVVNVQPSVVYDTNKKFDGTKDYFGDPSVGNMISNGLTNMNQIPAGRTINDIVNAGFTGELGLGALNLGKTGLKTLGKAAGDFVETNPLFLKGAPLHTELSNMNETIKNWTSHFAQSLSPKYQKKVTALLEDANAWQKNWYNHPAAQERLKNLELENMAEANKQNTLFNKYQIYKNHIDRPIFKDVEEFRTSNHDYNTWNSVNNNIKNETYKGQFQTKIDKVSKFLAGEPRLHNSNFGISGEGLDTFAKNNNTRQNLVDKYSYKIGSTTVHEGNHGIMNGKELLNNSDASKLHTAFNLEDYTSRNWHSRGKDGYNQWGYKNTKSYLLDPVEIYPRIMELRRSMKLSPEQIVNDTDIEKIINFGKDGDTPVNPEFFSYINNPTNFKTLFNKFPVSVGTGIGAIGLANGLQKKENGGKLTNNWLDAIKD